MKTTVPRIAAKTVLDAPRPHFSMYLPKEAFDRLAEVARSSGDTLNVAASKIICQELGITWSPAVKVLSVDELRERGARYGREHYWRHADRMREKSRNWAREHREEICAKRRERRRLDRERKGPPPNGPKFVYPSEWNLLSKAESDRLKTHVRQAAYHASKSVSEYRDMLRSEANRIIIGDGGLQITAASVRGRNADAVRIRNECRDRLKELDRAIESKPIRPSTPDEVSLMPDMATEKVFRYCSVCRYFHKSGSICLKHGFGTASRNWCPSFVSKAEINRERRKCRERPEQPNRNRF